MSELSFASVPGDTPWDVTSPDLDLPNLLIDSITRVGNEFMLTVTGNGEGGRMLNPDTGEMVDVVDGVEATFTFRWIPTGDPAVDAVTTVQVNRLDTKLAVWKANGTPLRVLSEPGRSVYLIEDEERWAALPRTA